MIHFLYADDLPRFPRLAETMFRDRTAQFKERLDWKVSVDEYGFEVDEYDYLNPLYIIWETPAGTHGGSVRIMPTTGRTMTAEHFSDLTGGRVASPLIWECTRFCLAPSFPGAASALLAAGTELGIRFGIEHALGVVYASTLPLYRRLGCPPDVIGERDGTAVCLWPLTVEARDAIARRADFPVARVQWWFDASFPSNREETPDAPHEVHRHRPLRAGEGNRRLGQ